MRIGAILLMFLSTMVFSQEESQDEAFRSPAAKAKSKSKSRRKAKMNPARKFKNMIEFSRNGLDISNGTQSQELTLGGAQSTVDTTTNNLRINFARKIASNIWIQGIFNYSTYDQEYENTLVLGSQFNNNDSTSTAFTARAFYDFDTDPRSAFFVNAGFTLDYVESNSLIGTTDKEVQVNGFTVGVGKRFSLAPLGIPNAAYTISASYGLDQGTLDRPNGFFGQIDVNQNELNIQVLEINLFF